MSLPLPSATYTLRSGGTLRGRLLHQVSSTKIDQWWALSARHRWGAAGAEHQLTRDTENGSTDPRAFLQAATGQWQGGSRFFRAKGPVGIGESSALSTGLTRTGIARLELDPGGMTLWSGGALVGLVVTLPGKMGINDEYWLFSESAPVLKAGASLTLRVEVVGADSALSRFAAATLDRIGTLGSRMELASQEASDLTTVLRL
jgi:hypothetical protein